MVTADPRPTLQFTMIHNKNGILSFIDLTSISHLFWSQSGQKWCD